MRVIVSPSARASIRAIRQRLAAYSESAERNFTEALASRLKQLEMFPMSGREVPEYGVPLLRELVEPPYRIVYELFPDRVEVVIIRHGREEFRR